MRPAGCLQRIQTEQSRIVTHHFPEDFNCQEPFHGFTDPFRYAPHPAVAEAARLVISYIDSTPLLRAAFSEGKMLGVLVCRGGLYLAAFSGNVDGRSHVEGFVPPIFDLLAPDGYFKTREAEITELNHRVDILSHSEQMTSMEAALRTANEDKEAALADFRMHMAQSRIRREEVRNETYDPHILAGLIKESQFEKAEFKRLKLSWEAKIAEIQSKIQVLRDEIAQLKASRARMSDELQEWIFRQYVVHNALGESSSIADLFACKGLVPPGGTGECAAPKLLEYAYRNGLEPLAMGEFWYGRSPETAVRTHGHFYPSCTSKCGPLLEYMLPKPHASASAKHRQDLASIAIPCPNIIYEDNDIIVAEKPSGMPSVPGLDGRLSLEEYLADVIYFGDDKADDLSSAGVQAVHRLDMDTSGVMVFAKTHEAAVNLRRQFEEHTVRKTYMARVIAGKTPIPEGPITLPLAPDYDERPRQKVDFRQGKTAHTDFELVQVNPDGTADLLLYPHTGRTHQLRVHCAHTLGLGRPIIGDLLYGGWCAQSAVRMAHGTGNTPADAQFCTLPDRLHLHALSITLCHPRTDKELTFTARGLCY